VRFFNRQILAAIFLPALVLLEWFLTSRIGAMLKQKPQEGPLLIMEREIEQMRARKLPGGLGDLFLEESLGQVLTRRRFTMQHHFNSADLPSVRSSHSVVAHSGVSPTDV
jgi:hypothetical protein